MAKKKNNKDYMEVNKILEGNDEIKGKPQLMANLRKANFDFEFRNESQKELWHLVDNNQIVLCSGAAGTGKSYISALKAFDLVIRNKENKYKKIIIIKPAVEAGESNGFLPGSLFEKMYPFVYSTLYIFEKIIGKKKLDALLESGIIEIMSLAYMRGISIDDTIVIMEEAQNMTDKQMITLLTRIGENSKMIINGDIFQSDRYKNGKDSGLYYAMEKLKNMDDIGMLEFKDTEIVRNPLIQKMLERFNGDAINI